MPKILYYLDRASCIHLWNEVRAYGASPAEIAALKRLQNRLGEKRDLETLRVLSRRAGFPYGWIFDHSSVTWIDRGIEDDPAEFVMYGADE